MKKLLAFVLVFTLALSLSVTAFADPAPDETLYPEQAEIDSGDPQSSVGIKITKHPLEELYIRDGGEVIFTSFAEGYTGFYWEILTAKGVVRADEITKDFPDLKVIGADTSRIKLEGVGYDQYGWKFRCVYTNDRGELASDWAELRIVKAVKDTPCAKPDFCPKYDPYGGVPIPGLSKCGCGPVVVIGG